MDFWKHAGKFDLMADRVEAVIALDSDGSWNLSKSRISAAHVISTETLLNPFKKGDIFSGSEMSAAS